MLGRHMTVVGVAWLMAVGPSGPAWATIDNLKTYKQAYPGREPKAYSCKVCHEGAVGKKGDLNAYGLALQRFKADLGAKKLTAEDFQAFEAADTDGDGATNQQELEAGTDLADPASAPPGPAAPSSTEEAPGGAEAPHPEDNHEHAPGPSSSRERTLEQIETYLDQWTVPAAWADEPPLDAAASAAPVAEYVGTETCAACHAKQAKEFERSTHARVSLPGDPSAAQGCEMCHGPGSLHVEAGGDKGVGIINPRNDPSTCYACHTDKRMEFALQHHHPVPEGRMSCADCHALHGDAAAPRSARAQNDLCLSCHEPLKGPWVFEHLALRDGCLTCHAPHGSITTQLLTERDFNLCLKCHFSGLQYQRLGHYAHRRAYNPSGMEGAVCTGCHRAVHGSNFSKELRTQ